ncbi:hypothetical protein GLOTRDRAFT_136912 [Gloeophyllum trabeum ATCC 11539]|uniref:Uncharacterized protein n=1 Tax=Gloeophyllum trabeum (strain ATCC 11539 / FP-39264 / Madison 617) TaxID=670483 RepID=S7RXP3_GLOTA|nr:uncharacterized protein GLOTRDRAFT_136912 [Gloeophyllum trabeum ATCC 11539]EPQ58139.1 hypothetical protein GLOTRDRAFT_136912 [Gloeophyllum trabeum ATCC 11539]
MSNDESAAIPPEISQPPLVTEYSDSEDSDSAPRVYFGPIQSPEKELTSKLAHRNSLNGGVLKTPVRRLRMSTEQALTATDSGTQAEENDNVRQGEGALAEVGALQDEDTLDRELDLDEPSSALAGKILRAHDNPSPPPADVREDDSDYDIPTAHRSRHTIMPSRVLDFGDVTDQSDVERAQGAGGPEAPIHSMVDSTATRTLKLDTELPTDVEEAHNTSAPDLIAFDSFSTPSRSTLDATAALRDTAPTTSQPTVDDLLSASPVFPLSAVTDATADSASEVQAYLKQVTPVSGTGTSVNPFASGILDSYIPSTGILINVNTSPATEQPQGPVAGDSSALVRFTEDIASNSQQAPSHVLETKDVQADESTARTPRRSSRLSTSPYKTPRHTDTSPRKVPALKLQVADESRSALAVPEKVQVRAISPSVDTEAVEKEKKARRRERESQVKGKRKEEASTDLSHLSPTSADLLTKLMPTPSRSVSPAIATVEESGVVIPAFLQRNQDDDIRVSRKIDPESRAPSTPPPCPRAQSRVIQSSALRPSNPQLRPTDRSILSTPMKLASALNDPCRTPARRIPMSQAVKEGSISPEKAAQVASSSKRPQAPSAGPLSNRVFKRLVPDLSDPNRSPAKRAPVGAMVSPSKNAPIRSVFSSPAKPMVRERSQPPEPPAVHRSRSVEPEQPARQAIVGQTIPRPGSAPIPDIVPRFDRKAADRPPRNPLPFPIMPIPEETEPPSQPSSSRTQKAVPSAQPKSALRQPSATTGSRIPRIGSKPYARPAGKSSTLPTPPDRNARAADRDIPEVHAREIRSPESTLPSTPPREGIRATRRNAADSETSSPACLKRKREEPPTKLTPVVVVRKVVPGGFGSEHVPMSSPLRIPEGSDGKPRGRGGSTTAVPLDPTPSLKGPSVDAKGKDKECPRPSRGDGVIRAPSAISDKQPDPKLTSSAQEPSTSPRPLTDKPVNEEPVLTPTAEGDSRARRTRSRKPLQHGDDVFGTAASRSRPPPRRRVPAHSSAPMPFIGMTQVALRALTNKNTQANQKYWFIDIETEVVRKPGPRPDSPTTKVKTAIQKQKEEQDQGRRERAQRRARRTGGSLDDEGGDTTADDSFKLGEPAKHQRGPGDETDYETPEKLGPAAKKARFDSGVRDKDGKRVKWDKGLHTLIYLDDPKPERTVQGVKKGGLAKSTKELRLDDLGNVPNAKDPLPIAVHEKVIVKKFVYDNDPEAAVVEVETPKPKSRKSKT